jgi:hypothetical protein
MDLHGWRLVVFVALLGAWALAAVVGAGWLAARSAYPDRRMPGYEAWMKTHRPGAPR